MIDLRLGDCLSVLRDLPAGSVQCCVTSPPYFGLRDYGVDGQIGLEETPEQFIDKLVSVFREVRRVLKDDGTLWLNLGDSYACSPKGSSAPSEAMRNRAHQDERRAGMFGKSGNGYKPKDLLMIPARVALALQADGWYLRSEIIWHKPNPMPESVRDRPTKAHEMIYLLAKQSRYFYDAEAVAEPSTGQQGAAAEFFRPNATKGRRGNNHVPHGHEARLTGRADTGTRNRRDVWTVTTKPYKEAHFATFPPDLIEPCILAGTSERGECPKCGRAWVRVVERSLVNTDGWGKAGKDHTGNLQGSNAIIRNGNGRAGDSVNQTLGWRPSCACVDESDHNGPFEPIPQMVLDPFNGSGTTGAVSVMHGRNYIGIELNPAYIELTQKRLQGTEMVMPLAEAAL